MNTGTPGTDRDARAPRLHRVLLLVPFAWQAALVPFVNDVAWQPWGLPFPMAWQMAGVVLTTLLIGCVYLLDRRIDARIGLGTGADGRDGAAT